jgi:SAM-dependent methyltransferase
MNPLYEADSESRLQSMPAGRLRNAGAHLLKLGRVLRNVATGADVSKGYPDKIIEILWSALPAPLRSLTVARVVGRLIHRRARRTQPSGEPSSHTNYTRFFRNPPQLELLRDLACGTASGAPLRIAVLGCSTGAELYSALWMLRTAWPARQVEALGVDLSESCIRTAATGAYPVQAPELTGLSENSYERLFLREGNTLSIQPWLKEGVRWWVGDVGVADLPARFGLHQFVLANNFLFHMRPERAASSLRNMVRLVTPNGYLFIAGMDLAVRSAVARELGLIPVTAKLEDIYTAEEGMLEAWPLRFWGLEPMDRSRPDWALRYATVFQVARPNAAR